MGFVELQMTWQPSLLSEKRKKGPPLGLRNLGNSCYLNSVLQCLTYTPPLANFCLRSRHSSSCDASASKKPRDCPFCILEAWIARSLTLDLTLDSPSKIQSCIKIFAEHFRFGRQEDAHEFLRYVIDACHNTCLRLKKLRRKVSEGGGGGGEAVNGNTVVKEIFGGALQSQVKCLGCGGESNKVDEIMDISLDILNSGSLKEAMHKFFQPEVLDGNNKYKCDNCKKLVAARKQLSIRQAPNILVIQLKRFEGILGAKIDRLITFDEVLVLSSFMSKASQDPQPVYNLFGTIVHSGYSPESGHYYAYIKDAMGRWYCCNDTFVSLSTLQEVLSEKVYILFFSRANQRTGSHGTTVSSNGVKQHDSNGSEASKILKAVQLKPVQTKPCVEQSSQKVGKLSSSPRVKFNISEKPGPRKLPLTSNGKVDFHKTQTIAVNGVSMDSIRMEKNGKDTLSSMNRNCTDKIGKVDVVAGGNNQQFAWSNGNKPDSFVVNGTRSMAVRGQIDTTLSDASDNLGQKKSSENSCAISVPKIKSEDSYDILGTKHKSEDSSDVSGAKRKYENSCNFSGTKRISEYSCNLPGSKRKSDDSFDNSVPMTKPKDSSFNVRGNIKFKDSCNHSGLKETEGIGDFSMLKGKSCVLLSQDAQSRAEVEKMKEMLKNKASSVLRSCGWYVDVYNFMHSKKQSYAQETGSTQSDNDLEKKLIADAKPTFIPQIPESLKEELIKHLQSFSQTNRESPDP
ncbi:Ubiquitin carboxyl-terminal hydrolase 25 [Hibiscus syriacus]|uniref:Ubiquitin carboxyl-terminal hydrolase n=1 Tax=Hibiscus syriacus TaxID=106335 RepID=A0A6A3C8I0_HIBSY|nr:ubiquitin carboxyl-terminal hydrolase 25-like [Hibiscus syriacus]XP_039061064.1 ubiquitin carboxyl-terminal hydrolase 25-like [Hibiscus syriacus]KAE8723462.1 Ubiquitin carboxyl-terminal hydrolase 25 [Hibiscus syriacus]